MQQPKWFMLDRLALRAMFWGVLATIAGAGGLLSVGAARDVGTPASAFRNGVAGVTAHVPTFVEAAPYLSLAAFAMALIGLWLLQRELSRRTDGTNDMRARVQQLQDALHGNTNGIIFLRALRDSAGAITDFAISDVNPSGATLLRRDATALVGRSLRELLPADISDVLLTRYREVGTARTPLVEEVRVDHRQFAASWLYHQVVPTAEGLAVTLKDISARKREELTLRRASLTDELTGMYNRRGFLMLAEQQLRVARRQGKDTVLLYVDLDEFKPLNDRFGHAEGDRALAAVGRLLRRAVRDCDVVARMGGDEFTIMALDADRAGARLIQKRIEERVALLNASGELAAPIALTIGHTRVRPTDQAPLAELLARADTLLYARKKRRKLAVAAVSQSSARASVRPRTRVGTAGATGRPSYLPAGAPVGAAGVIVPPDVAAIARAVAVASAARVPSVGASTFSPTRVA